MPPWLSALAVTVPGATPPLNVVAGVWNGQPGEGDTYSNQVIDIAPGQDLFIELDTQQGFCCYTQLCGLQLVKEELVTPYCFGDGSGTACPSGNAGGPAEGCANSTGAGAWLEESSGSTSVNPDALRFTGHGLPAGQPALLFVGNDALAGGGGAPFGDGLLCVGNAIQRLTVAFAAANGDAFWGPGLQPLGGWSAGDVRRFQVWYRNPVGSPCGAFFNLTHGLEAAFVP